MQSNLKSQMNMAQQIKNFVLDSGKPKDSTPTQA